MAVLIVFLLLAKIDWRERAVAAAIALAPVALIAAVHSLIHAEGGQSSPVPAPSRLRRLTRSGSGSLFLPPEES